MIRLALVLALLLAPAAQASRLVTYVRSGGLAGEHTEVRVNRDRSVLLDDRDGHHEGRLSKKRYRDLRDALRAAHFDTLNATYPPKAHTNDGIDQSVRFRGKTVATSTGGEPPKRFQRVLERLDAIAAQ